MDIVRTNIERLSGNVTVETWAGRGTRFQIALPLTLAIIQSLLVDVGRGTYAIPLAAVMETLRIPLSDIHTSARQAADQSARSHFAVGRLEPVPWFYEWQSQWRDS